MLVVTGASSGIGLAVAQRAGAAGDHVVLVARDHTSLDLAAKECERAGAATTTVVPTDVGDDEAVRRAAVFVDTSAALDESGDLLGPIAAGMLAPGSAVTELAELCRGEHAGRSDAGQITLFKSVGTALADLAAATLAYDAWKAGRLTPPCG